PIGTVLVDNCAAFDHQSRAEPQPGVGPGAVARPAGDPLRRENYSDLAGRQAGLHDRIEKAHAAAVTRARVSEAQGAAEPGVAAGNAGCRFRRRWPRRRLPAMHQSAELARAKAKTSLAPRLLFSGQNHGRRRDERAKPAEREF